MSLRTVIITRGRSDTIESHKVFPFATIACPESEKEAYEPLGLPMVFYPDTISGISQVRNWTVKAFKETCVVMVDDDIQRFQGLAGYRKLEVEPDGIRQVFENSYEAAKVMKTRIFGYNQRPDQRYLNRNDFFSCKTWVGGIVGFIGKKPQWDENLKCKCDIDACLTEMMKNRSVFTDCRYTVVQRRDDNAGGNSGNKSKEVIEKEVEYLKNKWGASLKVKNHKTQIRIATDVIRRQKLKL